MEKRIDTVWEVWTYDVWGNAKEGYDVNDRNCIDREYHIAVRPTIYNAGTSMVFTAVDPTDYAVKKAFGVTCDIETDGDEYTIYVNRKSDGYPIGEMIRV